MALKSSDDLNKIIDSIRKAGDKLDRTIQIAAVQAIGYSIEHGDITIGQRLLDAMPNGSRKASLVAMFERKGQFAWMKQDKKLAFFKVEGLVFNEKLLLTMPWYEFGKKETIVSVYDVSDMVGKLIRQVEKAIEAGKQIKDAPLLDELKLAAAKYHSSLVLAEGEVPDLTSDD